jgi:membrane-bound metal-dependent hydrolase YbcI (DUF457 family)
MFIGHFAVAFGGKRAAPAVSLGTLFLAGQLADLLWPTLVLAGVERFEIRPGATAVTPLDFVSYPWSHSLATLALWGALLGLAWAVSRKGGLAAAATLAAVVVSHWLLDFVSHRPDMPLYPGGGPRLGLGLWNSLPATVLVETILFAAGLMVYVRFTRPRDRTGTVALWALAAFLLLIYAVNLLGPPPPSVTAVAWTAQAVWLLVLWGYWVDRHRLAREPERGR